MFPAASLLDSLFLHGLQVLADRGLPKRRVRYHVMTIDDSGVDFDKGAVAAGPPVGVEVGAAVCNRIVPVVLSIEPECGTAETGAAPEERLVYLIRIAASLTYPAADEIDDAKNLLWMAPA